MTVKPTAPCSLSPSQPSTTALSAAHKPSHSLTAEPLASMNRALRRARLRVQKRDCEAMGKGDRASRFISRYFSHFYLDFTDEMHTFLEDLKNGIPSFATPKLYV